MTGIPEEQSRLQEPERHQLGEERGIVRAGGEKKLLSGYEHLLLLQRI